MKPGIPLSKLCTKNQLWGMAANLKVVQQKMLLPAVVLKMWATEGVIKMLFEVNMNYFVQTLNYSSNCQICHNCITSLILGIAASLKDSWISKGKYALLLL